MRIGIDGACLPNRRGFGRFAREVVRALAASNSPHDFVGPGRSPVARTGQSSPRASETVAVDVREAASLAASVGRPPRSSRT